MNVNFHSTPIITSNFTEACTLKISNYVYLSTYAEPTQNFFVYFYTVTGVKISLRVSKIHAESKEDEYHFIFSISVLKHILRYPA